MCYCLLTGRVSSEDNKPPKAYRNSSDDEMSEGFRRQKYKRNKKVSSRIFYINVQIEHTCIIKCFIFY